MFHVKHDKKCRHRFLKFVHGKYQKCKNVVNICYIVKIFPGKYEKKLVKKVKLLYIIVDTTFMFETGQDWKIAALKTSKCVCLFCR